MASLLRCPAHELLGPLRAFDLCVWLGSEAAAAKVLRVSQPTVNRSCQRLRQALNLPSRRAEPRELQGLFASQPPVLQALRRITQQLRFIDQYGLRLQCDQPLCEARIAELQQHGWVLGPSGRWSPRQAEVLLQQAVVDAWLPNGASQLLIRCDLDHRAAGLPSLSLPHLFHTFSTDVPTHQENRPGSRLLRGRQSRSAVYR